MNKKMGIIIGAVLLVLVIGGAIGYGIYDYNVKRYTRGETFVKLYETEYQKLDKTVREKESELAKLKFPNLKYSDARDYIEKYFDKLLGQGTLKKPKDTYNEMKKNLEKKVTSDKDTMIKSLDEAIAEAKK